MAVDTTKLNEAINRLGKAGETASDPIKATIADISKTAAGITNRVKPIPPITPESLSDSTPAIDTGMSVIGTSNTPINVPSAPTDPLAVEQAQKTAQAQTAEQNSFESLIDQMLNAPTEASIKAEQYKQYGVDEKQLRVDQLQTEMTIEADRLRSTIERIQSEGGGLKMGAQSEIANAERESYAKQADLALIQLAAQDQLDYATAVADRAVDQMFSRQQQLNSIRQMIYNRNKDLFDTEEQRLFQMRQSDRERKLNEEKEMSRLLLSAKTEAMKMAQLNGAPQSVIESIGRAESVEDVISVGGQWGNVDMLERSIMVEQLNKLREVPETLAPTQVIDQGGRKLLINTQTGEVIKDFGVVDVEASELGEAITITSVIETDALKSHKGMSKAVGTSLPFFPDVTRFTPFTRDVTTGEVSDFVASVEYLTSGLTLDELAKAKENGTTFGALSKDEWVILAATATKIGTWKRERDDGSIYYDTSEKSFNKEIDRISNFKKLDAYLKGTDPASIGLVVTEDGVFAQNADGSVTKLK